LVVCAIIRIDGNILRRIPLKRTAYVLFVVLAMSASSWAQVTLPSNPRILGQAEDVLLRPVKIKPSLPDTLILGGWRIAVERYDSVWLSHDSSRPSGVGRIPLNCSAESAVHPPWWRSVGLTPKVFEVVHSVADSGMQISLQDAKLIDPDVRIGGKVSIDLPSDNSVSGKSVFKNIYVEWLKKLPASGARVRFRDIKWIGGPKVTVVLTEGMASYPTTPAVPAPPVELQIAPGFSIAVDSLVITSAGASVQGEVLLPSSIIDAGGCTRAKVRLPMTPLGTDCQLYASVPDSTFGPFFIGSTDIEVRGTGYVVDFSSVSSDPSVAPALSPGWAGIVLRQGVTPGSGGDPVISNRGYVHARYNFSNALVTNTGFAARLNLAVGFTFTSFEPFGYEINLPAGFITVGGSAVSGGEFQNGMIRFPVQAVQTDFGGRVRASYSTMEVQGDMDLYADIKVDGGFQWGEFVKTTGSPRFYRVEADSLGPSNGYFFLSARNRRPYYPITPIETFMNPSWTLPISAAMETQGMQGATIPFLTNRRFTIYTNDVPDTTLHLQFPRKSMFQGWLNVSSLGVHGQVGILKDPIDTIRLGPKWQQHPKYRGEESFLLDLHSVASKQDNPRVMVIRFVESCVWDCDINGKVILGGPVNASLAFRKLMFTSTANCAGGDLSLAPPATLDYWGVQLVAQDSTKSAGSVCVKTGVIYLTAAGIAEPRHFSRPFFLTWGEMKASGNMGRLFFDYNNVGQKFDRYFYTPSFVQLSKWVPTDSGYVEAYGSAAVGFFGAKNLSVLDWKAATLGMEPYINRRVRVPLTSPATGGLSDLHWARTWASGLANLDFTMAYDSLAQDGFLGNGTASITAITGNMNSVMKSSAEGSCFRIAESTSKSFTIGPLSTAGVMGNIWGCGCILGEKLERIAVGGELSASGGLGSSISARAGSMVSVIAGFTPTRTTFELNGDMYVVVWTAGAEISGMASFVFDRGEGYVEGRLKGAVSVNNILGGVEGQGELDWHLGAGYQAIQGRIAVSIYGWTSGIGSEAGFMLGVNAPKTKVWVMDGINGRFGLNKGALPDNLTGFYAYFSVTEQINLFIVSGGYQVYIGLGSFVDSTPAFYVVGNVGVRIWGEILGGLIGASAYGQLAMVAGLPHPGFQGAIGLEACALWIFCGSVDVHCGFNHNDGFYLY
jgi:hypothetical protein